MDELVKEADCWGPIWGPMRGLALLPWDYRMKRGHHTKKQTHIMTTRPTRPRGRSWWKNTFDFRPVENHLKKIQFSLGYTLFWLWNILRIKFCKKFLIFNVFPCLVHYLPPLRKLKPFWPNLPSLLPTYLSLKRLQTALLPPSGADFWDVAVLQEAL